VVAQRTTRRAEALDAAVGLGDQDPEGGLASPRPDLRRIAYELGLAFGQYQDLPKLVSFAVDRCRQLLDVESVAVLLWDAEHDELYFPHIAEAEDDAAIARRLAHIRFPADRGIAGAVLRSRASVRIDDVTVDARFFGAVDQMTGRRTQAVLCVPLISRHQALGVIEAVNPLRPDGFADGDLALLEVLAESLAAAIDRDSAAPAAVQLAADQPAAVAANSLRKTGEYWTVVFAGRRTHLKDAKGLAYIAHLLRHPRREFHVSELINLGGATAAADDSRHLGTARDPGYGGPVLDRSAPQAYAARLAELRAELEQAQHCCDPGRIARAEHELRFLTQELQKAVGLGGRERRAGSHAERARVNITRAISVVIKKIGTDAPDLGHHLAKCVKTGTFCCYTPDPRVGEWDL
jgi:hypothetical protein